MSKQEKNIINYIVICINEFAKQCKITSKEAYLYLKDYKGLEFLKECYEAEHTISLDDAIDDLKQICMNNGGNIKELTYKELTDQYSFHTEKALKYLKGI